MPTPDRVPDVLRAGGQRQHASSAALVEIDRDAVEQLREAIRSHRLVTWIGPGGRARPVWRWRRPSPCATSTEMAPGWSSSPGVLNSMGWPRCSRRARGECVDSPGRQPAGRLTAQLIVRHLAVAHWSSSWTIANTSSVRRPPWPTPLLDRSRASVDCHEPRAAGCSGEVLGEGRRFGSAGRGGLVRRARRSGLFWFHRKGTTRLVIEDICRRRTARPWPSSSRRPACAHLHWPRWRNASRIASWLLTAGARTALPRQQSLRAVVDWSYDLLFDDERLEFTRLAAFPGGCG